MRIQAALASCVLSALASCASHAEHGPHDVHEGRGALVQASISHDVFLTLSTESEDDINGLIAACERLRGIPGVVHLSTGRRDPQRTKDSNETTFHVALHVEFVNQAAYDAYGPHEIHQALVTEYGPKFGAVLVYDALLR